MSPVAAGAITSQMSPRVVETQYGRLRGVLVSIADPTSTGQPARRVEVYLGLQYASLHGGELRFMPPNGPMEKWDGVRVALKHRPVCPQPAPDLNEPGLTDRELARRKRLATFVEKQQEDCLTLNIYVPARGQSEAIYYTTCCFVNRILGSMRLRYGGNTPGSNASLDGLLREWRLVTLGLHVINSAISSGFVT